MRPARATTSTNLNKGRPLPVIPILPSHDGEARYRGGVVEAAIRIAGHAVGNGSAVLTGAAEQRQPK
jgi:hypothetical protein